ncbi:hypothetical protein TNCV_1778581 [Trichonephila clavipes]|nr:hypothetical protein TNCV_1778581 [Trichonephila clavipes]
MQQEISITSFRSAGLPENDTIITRLSEPCTKSELTDINQEKRIKIIEKYPKNDFEFVFTDSSYDEAFSNGGLGVFLTTSSGTVYQRVIGAVAIASCFTCELRAIIEVLDN